MNEVFHETHQTTFNSPIILNRYIHLPFHPYLSVNTFKTNIHAEVDSIIKRPITTYIRGHKFQNKCKSTKHHNTPSFLLSTPRIDNSIIITGICSSIVKRNLTYGLASQILSRMSRQSYVHSSGFNCTPSSINITRSCKIGFKRFSTHSILRNQQKQLKEEGKDKTAAEKSETPNSPLKLSSRDAPLPLSGWNEIFRLISLMKNDKLLFFMAILCLLITSLTVMCMPMAIGRVLDAATSTPDEDEKPKPVFAGLTLGPFLACLAIVCVVGTAANFGRNVMLKLLGERLVSRIRSHVLKRTLQQDAEFYDVNRVGDLLSRLSTDTYVVSRSLTTNVSDGVRAILAGAIGLGMMSVICLKLSSVVLIFAPPVIIAASMYGRRVRVLSRNIQESVGSLTKVAEEQLSSAKTIQSYVGEVKEIHRYNNKIRDVFNYARKEAFLSGSFFSLAHFAGDASFIAMLGFGALMIKNGTITVGDLTAFMMYLEYTNNSVFNLSGFYSELMKGAGAASRLFELLDKSPSITSNAGLKMKACHGEIEFDNVSFHYPLRPNVNIFNGLSVKIPAGSNICVVGPSGRGKSTITSLILRFYDPNSGTIKIDGVDIRQYNLKSLRRKLGVVQQEPVLLSGTIAENIAYGLPLNSATKEEIETAARRANCGFVYNFPLGLDTLIGPRGSQLSGGQKQRIAIARALIKKPGILILDEATSALDSESEHVVNYMLHQLRREEPHMTVISIAHRLSTIRRAEDVIVLGYDGNIVEYGKFRELYANPKSELSKLLKSSEGEDESKNKRGEHNDELLHQEDEESLVEEQLYEELVETKEGNSPSQSL